MSLSSRSLSLQEAAELEFLSVNYTLKKWKGAARSPRALYWNIMLENCCSLAPLGKTLLPSNLESAFFTFSLLCSYSFNYENIKRMERIV